MTLKLSILSCISCLGPLYPFPLLVLPLHYFSTHSYIYYIPFLEDLSWSLNSYPIPNLCGYMDCNFVTEDLKVNICIIVNMYLSFWIWDTLLRMIFFLTSHIYLWISWFHIVIYLGNNIPSYHCTTIPFIHWKISRPFIIFEYYKWRSVGIIMQVSLN